MLLRRITKHVTDQNWFAVFIDFFIVVIGVFIGIQVANWNEAQAFNSREKLLLKDLQDELRAGIEATRSKGNGYTQVIAAATRSLAVLESKDDCQAGCWMDIVDFMHASQWQDTRINRSVYDEMRRLGLPRNRDIYNSMEVVLAQNEGNSTIFDDKPVYRNKIRQLIPFAAQEFYWVNCYSYDQGFETYSLNCPAGINNEQAAQVVKSITQYPEIKSHLTEWASNLVTVPAEFKEQNIQALAAIAVIDAELQRN